VQTLQEVDTIADWEKFWGEKDTQSQLIGEVRYVGGVLARRAVGVEDIPADFRLMGDSPGKGKGVREVAEDHGIRGVA
jgi:hypothetical protein